MQIHRQQGRVTKQESVVTIRIKWKDSDDLPVIDQDSEYPQFAALTGENEAGWPDPAQVNQKWLGEISTVDPDKKEVTIITPFHVKEQLQAAVAIDPAEIGKFVFQGQKVLPFDSTHNDSDVVGLVYTSATSADDPVWVLRK